ncbi:hypothetical protein HU200_065189 [Digitaria exilis]|uniref:Gnk2-homologous domain-containing protein n=1 Tax=Digitaria exilis TaxID=1010633 RepID=A0A835DV52_9POAL|nr:hypothetical protein HU200_065189 [Digitaria exilis]
MHHSARRHHLLAVAVVASLGATATATSYDSFFPAVTKQTCSAKLNYTDDSPYSKNVADLLSVLTSPTSAIDNWWFRRATVGSASGLAISASGLAMCFADSDASSCRSCFAMVTSNVSGEVFLPDCDHSRNVSLVSSDGCVIRYADAPFFGTSVSSGAGELVLRFPGGDFDGADAMRDARRALLGQLAEKAGGEAMRFATGSQGFMVRGIWKVMYGMAQCTRDLPASECTGCLVDLLAVMYRDVSVTNSTEASVMGFSCYLRYQMDEPIHIAGMALPPSPPPPAATHPTGSASPSTVGKMTTVLIAAAAVTLLITAIGV